MKPWRLAAGILIAAVALSLAAAVLDRPAPSALANRSEVTDLFGLPGRDRLFEVTVPPGAAYLHFSAWSNGRMGAVDLYARSGSAPTVDAFDAKSVGPADDKIISIPTPHPGKYYLLLRPARGFYWNTSLMASYALPGEAFRIGMHAHRLYNGGDADAPASREPRFRYALIRDWDISHLHDAALWKQDGSIDFSLVDKVYAAHANNGARVIKTFGTVPTWAAKRPQEANPQYPSWPGAKSGPRDLDAYEDYVFRFVSHSRRRLWAVEGWNEPYACPGDPPEFTTMTPTELADVQKRLYRAAKRVDPALLVLSPAQSYVCGIPTLLAARTSEGEPMSKYFDALAWHPYNRSARANAGPSFAREVAQVRRHLSEAGLAAMPIVDSEHGWLKHPKEGGMEFYAMDDAEKGEVLYETSMLAKSLGLLALIWYGYDNDMIGRPMDSAELSRRLDQMGKELNSRPDARPDA